MSMTNEQIEFVNDLAERLEAAEAANEQFTDLGDKLDSVSDLAKNFDFGSEISEIKQVLGQVVGFLGMDLDGAAEAVTVDGGVEKGDKVAQVGDAAEARRKDGMNFAAELMPVPGNAGAKEVASGSGYPHGTTVMKAFEVIAKRLDEMEARSLGRTSVQPTGEPIAKRAGGATPLFKGRF